MGFLEILMHLCDMAVIVADSFNNLNLVFLILFVSLEELLDQIESLGTSFFVSDKEDVKD